VRPSAASALPESEKDRHLVQLEREVEGLRDYLRAAIEGHSTIEEELKSAHEEVLSANEEFQSTNEELETSKEELQSTNEELTTTIEELRTRNQELAELNAELARTRMASDRARSFADIIIETVREPLAVLDGAQRILRVNSAFSANLEISRTDAEGRLLRDINDGRWNHPELRQKLDALLADGQPLEDLEVTVDLSRQGRRVVSLTARKIPGDADRADLLLLALEDITDRTNVTAGLVANVERRDQFLAMLGHELRHPLTPIMHAIYLLKRRDPDPASAELLDSIDTEARRLLRFVNELLDVQRLNRGLVEIQRHPLDFVVLARRAVASLQPLIEQRQQALALDLPDTPIFVEGDADRLNQVITNLVENAAKYTEPGGRIAITLEQSHDKAVLRVRDNGIGIAADDRERVFEPFIKSRNPLASARSGLGLGLSVVRKILELHGGDIHVTSTGLAKGSEFVVTLPLSAAIGTLPGPTAASLSQAAPRRRRVLVVDDHKEVRDSVARLVRAWGHEVALAEDGRSALSVAHTFHPDCAIVDISLPGMNGIELARSLRKMFPPSQLFLIALTGHTGAHINDACLGAGFDLHLVKPGEIDLLEKVLANEHPEDDIAAG
jgi:two-component system CheB/CheR fusion protein